jgi:probable phosphoglycerate mutase
VEPRRVVLVRHGETEWALSGRHTGRKDLPLTARGEAQAAELRGRLGGRTYGTVLCSPLIRARKTCEGAGFGVRASIDPDLQEWDYGDYEGLTGAEIRARRPDWLLFRDGCPGGESPADVIARVGRLRRRLAASEGEALIFAHGHLLRVLTAEAMGLPIDTARLLMLGPASISVLLLEADGDVLLERWNAVP